MSDFDSQPWLGVAKGIRCNVAADVFIPIPCGDKGVIFRSAVFTNPSTSLAATTTAAGIYTAVSAGGTAIVTASTANLTPLTAATSAVDYAFSPTAAITLSAPANSAQSTGVYVSVGGTPTVAGTFDVYIGGQVLT
jgi:hypothetical protein